MELKTIRWRNARLIHLLSQMTLKALSSELKRDPALVGKWFAATEFKKNIGDASARLIEKTFADIILTHCNGLTSHLWLDDQHETLWSSKLGIKVQPTVMTVNIRRDQDKFDRSELVKGILPIFRYLEQAYGIDSHRFLEFALLNIELNSNNPGLQEMAAMQILSYDDVLKSTEQANMTKHTTINKH